MNNKNSIWEKIIYVAGTLTGILAAVASEIRAWRIREPKVEVKAPKSPTEKTESASGSTSNAPGNGGHD